MHDFRPMGWFAALALATLIAAPLTSWAQVELTPEQDRQRLMDLLDIESLRPAVSARNPDAEFPASWDEANANPYPNLPDPLTLKNGKKVTSAKMWWEQRRPEIVEDFDREVYGRVPGTPPSVEWEVTETENAVEAGVPVVKKLVVGHVDNSSYPQVSVDIEMQLTTPANAAGPVPAMMHFGGHRPRPGRTPRPLRPGENSPTWQEQIVMKGWGYVMLNPASIQPDNAAGLTQGIIGLMNKGQPRDVDHWGSLRALGWGAARALDYLETDSSVDARRVGIEGVSRSGKAALVTMAYDERFAIAFIGSSGEGGAKLHRRNYGEPVENIAALNEYHWVAGNFLKYASTLTWDDLPVDSHELIALCAPRPVFLSAGLSTPPPGDGWVDAKGSFLAAVGAGPVYDLLGKEDLGTDVFPPVGTRLIDGDLGFHQHAGGHTSLPSWPTFLEFAERQFQSMGSN